MEIFTESPAFIFLQDIEFNTEVSDRSESGKENRRNLWPVGIVNNQEVGYAIRTLQMEFKGIDQTRYSNIVTFFAARKGRKEAFYFENFNESPILNFFPNKITLDANYQGSNTTQIPHYPLIANSQTIYDDGVALVEGVDYSLVDATGVITWIIKPANTSIITANYRFYRVVRFDHDKLPQPRIAYQKYNLELTVIEIEPRL